MPNFRRNDSKLEGFPIAENAASGKPGKMEHSSRLPPENLDHPASSRKAVKGSLPVRSWIFFFSSTSFSPSTWSALEMTTIWALLRDVTGSLSMPSGMSLPLPKGQVASTSTMSTSRPILRCWNPSSATATPEPLSARNSTPESLSAATATGTPGSLSERSRASSPRRSRLPGLSPAKRLSFPLRP